MSISSPSPPIQGFYKSIEILLYCIQELSIRVHFFHKSRSMLYVKVDFFFCNNVENHLVDNSNNTMSMPVPPVHYKESESLCWYVPIFGTFYEIRFCNKQTIWLEILFSKPIFYQYLVTWNSLFKCYFIPSLLSNLSHFIVQRVLNKYFLPSSEGYWN